MTGLTVAELLRLAMPDVAIGSSEPLARLWLSSGSDAPAFALRSVAGRPSRWHAERPAEIATDLDAAQPLLDRLEQVSGWRFEPNGFSEEAPAKAFSLEEAGTVIELALDPAEPAPSLLVDTVAALPRDATVPFPRMLQLAGPVLPVEEAAELSCNDLVLLSSPIAVRLTGSKAALRLDLASGRLSSHRWEAPVSNGLAVPLTIELGPVLLSDHEIMGVEQEGDLAIGAPPDLGAAALFVGDRQLGRGQLVRLGSGWAVRLDSVGGETA